MHLLDIAENSISANSKSIKIVVTENSIADLLQMKIIDDGKGMSPEFLAQVIDPFTTTRTTRRVGLGIPLLKEAAEACNGYLSIDSTQGKGTSVTVQFQRSHIDRMPLGDLVGTILHLFIGNPHIHWVFQYQFNDAVFAFDDAPIKQELGDIPLSEPDILKFVRETLENGIKEVNPDYAPDEITLNFPKDRRSNVYH